MATVRQFLAVLTCAAGAWMATAGASGLTITQVSNDDFHKYHPQVNDRGEIAWMGQRIVEGDYSYIEVFVRGTDGGIRELAVDGYRAAGYPAINANGDVAWQGRDIHTGQGVVFLYRAASARIERLRKETSDDTMNYGGPDISDNGLVVWSASWQNGDGIRSGIFVREIDGTVSAIFESDTWPGRPRINARGDVIWMIGSELWRRERATGEIRRIAERAFNPEINRYGDIVWTAWSDASGGYDVYLYKRFSDSTVNVTNNRCDDHEALISDSGDIIWTGSVADCGEYDIYVRKADGTVKRLTQNPYPYYGYWDKDINADGDAVFIFWTSSTTELFAYRAQTGAVFSVDGSTNPEWPQLNNVGQIVWQGTNANGRQVFTARIADGDGDGIPDEFDACPAQDARGFDADQDGCLDSVTGLAQVIATLPPDVLLPEIATSLAAKVVQAQRSADRSVREAAIRQLEAFINEIESQAGKKVSIEAADLLVAYARNVIRQLNASG